MSRRRFAGSVVNAAVSIMVIGGAAYAVLNRQAIIDWWLLTNYTPSVEIKQLADKDTMLGRGRDLFYVSDPKIEDSTDFNNACLHQNEQSIVLGCYRLQHIYLYNVADTRLSGVKEVTAAHEMLHAAYERLDTDQKQHINDMLKPIINTMQDQRMLDLIKLYNQQEPRELYNEMHSILGTEYPNLTPALEDYYKQYFTDRHKIVGYSQQYQAVFTASKAKIDEYDKQLGGLKTKVDQNNAILQQEQVELQASSEQLNQLRAQGKYENYNQAVPGYNAKVRDFNNLVAQTKELVDQYNQTVVERNNQAAAQNNLYESLNSHYQAVPQN